MKTDIFVLVRYWNRHRKQLFSVVLSVILLVAMLTLALLFERTDNRRELHEYYDASGAFDRAYVNVDAETIGYLQGCAVVEEIGRMQCVGRVHLGDSQYTVGAFADESSQRLAHYPLLSGRFPMQGDELAVTQDFLNRYAPLARIGEQITLFVTDLTGDIRQQDYTLVGIVGNLSDHSAIDNGISGTEFCDPQILISSERAAEFSQSYTNILITYKHGEQAALLDSDSLAGTEIQTVDDEMFARGYYIMGSGRLPGIQVLTGADDTEVESSPKTKILKFLSIFAVITAAISMFSGLYAVMQQRMESFRQLRCIGYSLRRIRRMLILESIGLLLFGLAAGFVLGIGVYEGLFAVQCSVFGLSAYRGYFCEWPVAARTWNPFSAAVIAATVTVAVSYLIPVLRLKSNLAVGGIQKQKKRSGMKSLRGAVGKILAHRTITILQTVSLVCVIFASMVGYLYCTKDNKGTSVVSMTSLVNHTRRGMYETANGIALDAYNMDAYLYTAGVSQNYMSPHTPGGLTQSELNQLKENGAEKIYAYSAPFDLVLLPDALTNSPTYPANTIPTQYAELFGLDEETALSAMPCILLNDELMALLSEHIGKNLPSDGAVWVNLFAAGEGMNKGEYSVLSVRSDVFGFTPEESKTVSFRVSETAYLDYSSIQNHAFLQKACSAFQYYGGFCVVSGEYAQALGLFTRQYTNIAFSAPQIETQEKLNELIYSVVRDDMQMQIQNVFSMKQAYIYDWLSEYATILCLFVLLLGIHMIGYSNILRLRLVLKSDRLAILRCMGLSGKRLLQFLIENSLRVPLISTVLSAVVLIGFRAVQWNRYQAYAALIEQRDAFLESGKDITATREAIRTLRSAHLLTAEMWLPSWGTVFLILSALICAVTVISVIRIQKNSVKHSLIDVIRRKGD